MSKPELPETKNLFVQNWKEIIGALSGFVAIIYGAGFLITNIFLLSEYEIYDFALIKARYVYVGAIYSMFLFIAFWTASLIYNNKDKVFPPNIQKYLIVRVLYTILAPVALGITVGTFVKSLLIPLASFNDVGLAFTAIQMRIWMVLAIWAFYYVIWLLRSGFSKLGNAFPIPYSLFTAVLIISIIYARWVYPFLPFALGGGIPTTVRFVIDDEKATQLSQTIPINSENISDIVYLIDQSEFSYFILVPNTSSENLVHPVEIKKELILGIIHEKNVIFPFLGNTELMPKITPSATSTATPP